MSIVGGYEKHGFDAYGEKLLKAEHMKNWMSSPLRVDSQGISFEVGTGIDEVEDGFFLLLPTIKELIILPQNCRVIMSEETIQLFRKNDVLIRGNFDGAGEKLAEEYGLRFLHKDVKLAAAGNFDTYAGAEIITLRFRQDGRACIHQNTQSKYGGGENSIDLPEDFYVSMTAEQIADKCWGDICIEKIKADGVLSGLLEKAKIKGGFYFDGKNAEPGETVTPSNPNAQECVKRVMNYLNGIGGNRIVTGQHVQDKGIPEYHKIMEVTGKEPALLGFELLSYSPNINYADTDEECMKEVRDNRGILEYAWDWAEKKGLITFTWHWFSPLYGRSKSFFTENTSFDADKAVTEGTAEHAALMSDLHMMAGILRPFCDKQIPILWRPFHEGEGKWFWWGAKGGETVAELYRIMYDCFTKEHQLNNLIWVWNATIKECYPGDKYVDIITRDMYPPAYEYTDRRKEYEGMLSITNAKKIIAIGETGVVIDPDLLHKNKTGWAYYMTWSHDFCLSEKYNRFEDLKNIYDSKYSITKEDLPVLY